MRLLFLESSINKETKKREFPLERPNFRSCAWISHLMQVILHQYRLKSVLSRSVLAACVQFFSISSLWKYSFLLQWHVRYCLAWKQCYLVSSKCTYLFALRNEFESTNTVVLQWYNLKNLEFAKPICGQGGAVTSAKISKPSYDLFAWCTILLLSVLAILVTLRKVLHYKKFYGG